MDDNEDLIWEDEEDQSDLGSHPCPNCGTELPDDASPTLGLCTECYEAAYTFTN